ncbi:MAG: hypothetical protein ABIR96_12235 [Bdellovibrionota bacterium]
MPKISLFLFLALNSGFAHAAPSEVLVIGDSQSYGSFGSRLLKALRDEHKTTTSYYARPGSGAQWWLDGSQAPAPWGSWNAPQGEDELRVPQGLPTPLIGDLIATHQPHLVVVQLGGNMVPLSDETIRKSAAEVITTIKLAGSGCLWIGPPPGDARPEPRYSDFYKVLKESAESNGCTFVDSRPLIKPVPHGGDGRHLDTMQGGIAASKQWTKAVSENILTALHKSAAVASPNSKASPLKRHR